MIEILPNGIVRKSMDNVGLQGAYCRALSKVCPEVYDLQSGSYTMEQLNLYCTPPDGDVFETMLYVYSALMKHVWPIKLSRYEWQGQLCEWGMECAPHYPIRHTLEQLYPYSSYPMYFIHGDPTLSNLMLRGEELVISDPIPPQGKIPGYPEVDVGKTFQSLIGWEHVVFGWPMPKEEDVESLVRMFPPDMQRKALFWLFIHLWRILPYARARRDSLAFQWANFVSNYMHLKILEADPCSMLMTLMEHSRTRRKQYETHTSGPG